MPCQSRQPDVQWPREKVHGPASSCLAVRGGIPMEQKLGRRDMLKTAGVLGAASALAILNGAEAVQAADTQTNDGTADALLGVWLVKVFSDTYPGQVYNYFYSFARGGYVATGDVDEDNGAGQKASPTMGVYVRAGRRTVRYREKGWIYDLSGKNTGTSDAAGTFTLDQSGKTITGPGVYNQYDLQGNLSYGPEQLHVTGTKVAV